jgi:hypothetical protein
MARDGTILYMNEKASASFASRGGREALVGKSLYPCHGAASAEKIRSMVAEGRVNTYTISKGGVRKLIYQAPWRDEGGEVAGLVELSLELPDELPHFDRG